MASQTQLFEQNKISPTELERVLNMNFPRFTKSNLAIQIISREFPGDIWFAADRNIKEQILKENPKAVVYTSAEILKLISAGITKKGLRVIHDAKSALGGRVFLHKGKRSLS